MKWLIILFLLLILAVFVIARYRRQIQTALYMYRMFRKMRQMSKPDNRTIEPKSDASVVPLVRCAGCGNWVDQSNVLKMGNKISYCSAACIEKATLKQ